MANATHDTHIKDPGTLRNIGGFRSLMIILALVGLATFGAALAAGETKAAWTAWTINHFYFMALAVGGLFFAAIQWATNAMWSAPVRRLAESFTAYLPVAFLTFGVLVFGAHELYEWTHSDVVAGDHILSGKSAYLNIPFFVIRGVAALVVWWIFARVLVGNSLAMDRLTPDSSQSIERVGSSRKAAPAFLAVFAITFTVCAFDVLMSLQPHWFSTIFGVYAFAGLLCTTFPVLAILTIVLRRKGYLQGLVNENHLHDIGKFMFAFTVFWTYIAFSQYMLIWYANLPEETGFYILRMSPGWKNLSAFLLIGKFAAVFLALVPRDSKRSEGRLLAVAIFMLIAQWIDYMWIVQPVFYGDGPHFSWVEVGTTVGFIGLFGFMVSGFLSRHNVVAIGDHRLHESVAHHHQ